MQHTHISLAHGNGGRHMRELIEQVFTRHLANPSLDIQADAVALNLPTSEIMMTTDGFSVQPLEFPGGDIGSLAVHGTCNDLAVAGAVPRYLSLNVFIEEGLEVDVLERIVISLAKAAAEINVSVVAGDTKVVPRGQGGGLYLATTGIGLRQKIFNIQDICDADAIIVSGPVGDHGIAVMLAQQEFGLQGDIKSDAAHVLPLTEIAQAFNGLRFMRDPTRGGLATVCTEIQHATAMGVRLMEQQLPIRDAVQSVCDMLGYDPLYLACEGRVVAVIQNSQADALVSAWQQTDQGKDARIIGRMDKTSQRVILQTRIGGERIIEELEDDPLPRIC